MAKDKKFNADVIVFVHAPTREIADELLERFVKVAENNQKLSFRFVLSSDDTGETR